jgi:hypothetical protein
VLWKFEGLADAADGAGSMADAAAGRIALLAQGGWTIAPLAVTHGFVATPWLDARPLTRAAAADESVVRRIAGYIAAVSPGTIGEAEHRAGWERLAEMLCFNARESLGDAAGDAARRCADVARALLPPGPVPKYGDGRLAPHEWLRAPDGRVVKTDCAGHEADHTVVGRQPIAWDVAGAIIEWDLDAAGQAVLLERVGRLSDSGSAPALLAFYLSAYAAFRVGLCSMCLAQTSDPAERARLRGAESFYRVALAAGLRHPRVAQA